MPPEGIEAAEWRLGWLPRRLRALLRRERAFIGGNSNDAWLFEDCVLRVCWRGDRDRITREAAVLESLPMSIPHPTLLDTGRTVDLSWLVISRGPGVPLDRDDADREGLIRDVTRGLSGALRQLHQWTPPTHVAALLEEVTRHDGGGSACAKEVVPTRVDDIIAVCHDVAELRFVDPGLIRSAVERVEGLREFAPATSQSNAVVHGDPAWGNVLVHDGRLSAVIDFEWVRLGPIELELVVPIFLGYTFAGFQRQVTWMREDYPELFAGEHFAQRMWLYQLSFAARGVLWWPPDSVEEHLTREHHLHNLRRLVDGPFFLADLN